MSIHSKISVINRIETIITNIKKEYQKDRDLGNDLNKLEKSLQDLKHYLTKLDHLEPNYTTNEVNHYMNAINVDLDILKPKLQKKDYRKLQNAFRVLKTILKFHPNKYSFVEYTILWFYELLYFI